MTLALDTLRGSEISTYDQMVEVVDECCGPGVGLCLFCSEERECRVAWDRLIDQMFDASREWRAKRKGRKPNGPLRPNYREHPGLVRGQVKRGLYAD